jgi:hypothetical protein
MIKVRRITLVTAIIFFYFTGYTQIFGGNPPSLRWKQINTPASRVIFPSGLDSTATRITNIISFIKEPTAATIGNKSKKINIVLQNQTTISNGYVALGPFRSEYFLTPSQNSFDLGSLPWPDQLTIHEYRHVEQFNNFNVGLSKVMHVLFGQEGQALANNAAIPNWFFEGDAVFNETNLSKQGRGSLPSFFNGYRSLWEEGKDYSWLKLRNGSLKDFVPDHYALGYLLVAYGREKYGDQFWEKVTQDAAAYKSLIYPFQHAIKKYSGTDYVIFRNEAIRFFKKEFGTENIKKENTRQKETYTNEQYPSFDENGAIIYVKNSFQKIPEFVIRTGNHEKKIRTSDNTIDNYFSYRNGKIVYASYRPDVRWGYRDYSDLQIIDVTNGKQQTLSHRSKYFSPDINNNGKIMVAVNEPSSGKYNLHLLNAENGDFLKSIPNPDKLFYTYPKFYGDKIISAVRNNEGKMSLAAINFETNTAQYLLPFTYNVIAFPFIRNDTLYFSYSYQKNEELFAYTFSDKKIWKIQTSHQEGLGKYHPTINNSNIVWSSFTAEGYRLQQVAKNDLFFREMSMDSLQKNSSDFGVASINNQNSNLLHKVPNDSFAITKYPKSFKLFNFHSLEPAVDDPQYTLSLISENILNTLQSNFSFTYDRAERFKQLSFGATYTALFPYLSAGVNYTLDTRSVYNRQMFYFNQLEPFAGFSIPLNLSKGRSFTFLNIGSYYVYNQSRLQGNYKDTFGKAPYNYLSNFLSFSHQVQKAQQQLFPRYAQSIRLSYKNSLTQYNRYLFFVSGNLYLPGFTPTQSLVLNGSYLKKDSLRINSPTDSPFSSGFPFSRGYQSVNFYEMYKWGVNYHLPLLYPDAGFASILYFLRIRANLFYDETHTQDFYSNGKTFKAKFRSTGTEINFDTKWWNQVNVSFGVRYSHLLDPDLLDGRGRNRWEIILPVNIFNN